MIDDDCSLDSGNASFDTSAALRPGSLQNSLHELKCPGDGEISFSESISKNQSIGSTHETFSLEATRQKELKQQAVINALNQFIVQAGNIYRGNKLSAVDADRLRKAATHAGLSVKVVDALIKQTADQNAMMEYCATSDDVFTRKIKEYPQLSQVLLQKGPERGIYGLNVSNSVWRIFLHKIIKQFLREQNMQLGDIIEKSLETRQLYEDALRGDPKEKFKFDTSSPRDYSEERKHVFISEADAKLARLEASEAMIKFQQSRNASIYDLASGTSIQHPQEFQTPIKQTEVYSPDSRDDDLSMVPCATEREYSLNRRRYRGAFRKNNSNEDYDQSVAPRLADCEGSSIQRIEVNHEENVVSTTLSSKSVQGDFPVHEIETTDQEYNELSTTPSPTGCHPKNDSVVSNINLIELGGPQLSPTGEEFSPDENNSCTASEPSKHEAPASPRTMREINSPTRTPGRTKVSNTVRERMVMFENSPKPSQPKSNSSIQNTLPFGNVLQTRAFFEKQDEQVPLTPEPNRKRQNTNMEVVLATWTQNAHENPLLLESDNRNNQIPASTIEAKMNDTNIQNVHENENLRNLENDTKVKIQTANIQGVRATWTQKEQENLLSSENDHQNKYTPGSSTKVKIQNASIQGVRATWTQKEQENLLSSENDHQNKHTPGSSTKVKIQNTSIQGVRATWTQKEQDNLLSSENDHQNKHTPGSKIKDKIQNPNIQDVRSTWTQKEQDNLLSLERDSENNQTPGSKIKGKIQNPNIQDVRSTWTQKEQDNLLFLEHDNENKQKSASGIKDIIMQKQSRECPTEMGDQECIDGAALKTDSKIKKIQNDDSVLGDKTSSFQNISIGHKTATLNNVSIDGTKRSTLCDTYENEVNKEENSPNETTKMTFAEVDVHHEVESNDQLQNFEKQRSHREPLPESTHSAPSLTTKLWSIDAFGNQNNEPIYSVNTKLDSDLSYQLQGMGRSDHVEDCFIEADVKFYDDLAFIRSKSEDSSAVQHDGMHSNQKEKRSRLDAQSQIHHETLPEEQKNSCSINFSGKPMGQNHQRYFPHNSSVHESIEVVKLSPSGSDSNTRYNKDSSLVLHGKAYSDQMATPLNGLPNEDKTSSSVNHERYSPNHSPVHESIEVVKLSPSGSDSNTRYNKDSSLVLHGKAYSDQMATPLNGLPSEDKTSSSVNHERYSPNHSPVHESIEVVKLSPSGSDSNTCYNKDSSLVLHGKAYSDQMATPLNGLPNEDKTSSSVNHERYSPNHSPVHESIEIVKLSPSGSDFFNRGNNSNSSLVLHGKVYCDQKEIRIRLSDQSHKSLNGMPNDEKIPSSANFSGKSMGQNHQRYSPHNSSVHESIEIVKLSPSGSNFFNRDKNNSSSLVLHRKTHNDQMMIRIRLSDQSHKSLNGMPNDEKIPSSVNLSGKPMGQDHEKFSPLNIIVAESDEVVKVSPFGGNITVKSSPFRASFSETGRNDFAEDQTAEVDEECHDELCNISSKSDDSSRAVSERIHINQTQNPRNVGIQSKSCLHGNSNKGTETKEIWNERMEKPNDRKYLHLSSVNLSGKPVGQNHLSSSSLNEIIAESNEVIKLSPFGGNISVKLSPFGTNHFKKGNYDFVEDHSSEVDEDSCGDLDYIMSKSEESGTVLHDIVYNLVPQTSHNRVSKEQMEMSDDQRHKHSSSPGFGEDIIHHNDRRLSPHNTTTIDGSKEVLELSPLGNSLVNKGKCDGIKDQSDKAADESNDDFVYTNNTSHNSSMALHYDTIYSGQTEKPSNLHAQSLATHTQLPKQQKHFTSFNCSGDSLRQNFSPHNIIVAESNDVVKLSPLNTNVMNQEKNCSAWGQNDDLRYMNSNSDHTVTQTDVSINVHVQPQKDCREMIKEQTHLSSVTFSGKFSYQNKQRFSPHNKTAPESNKESNKVVKLSPFGNNFFKKGKRDFQYQSDKAADKYDRFVYTNNKSDDSNIITAPPSESSVQENEAKVIFSTEPNHYNNNLMDKNNLSMPASTKKNKDECIEFPNQDAWFDFHPNNDIFSDGSRQFHPNDDMFSDESQQYSQKQAQSYHSRTRIARPVDASPRMLADVSNSFLNKEQSPRKTLWTDFESNDVFPDKYQEHSNTQENASISHTKGLKQDHLTTLEIGERAQILSDDRYDGSPRVKDSRYEQKGEEMAVLTAMNSVRSHGFSSVEKDGDPAVPGFLAVVASPKQIDHCHSSHGNTVKQHGIEDKSIGGSTLTYSSKANHVAPESNRGKAVPMDEWTKFDNEFETTEQEEIVLNHCEVVDEMHGAKPQVRSPLPNEARYFQNLIKEKTCPSQSEEELFFEKLLKSETLTSFFDSSSSGDHSGAPKAVEQNSSYRINYKPEGDSQYSRKSINESNFERMDHRSSLGENTDSNFQDAAISPLHEFIPQMTREGNDGMDSGNHNSMLNHSTSYSKDSKKVMVKKPTVDRGGTGNYARFGATDIHFMTRSSDSREVMDTDSTETEKRFIGHIAPKDDRQVLENELNRSKECSMDLTRNNMVVGEKLQTDLRNPGMNAATTGNHSSYLTREKRLCSSHGEILNDDADIVRSNKRLSMQSETMEILNEDTNCVTLDENHSLGEHHSSIRDFLKERGDSSEGHVRRSPQVQERTESDRRRDELTEQREHLEALSAFLAEYKLGGEKQPESSGLEKRQHDHDGGEKDDHFEEILGEYHQDIPSNRTGKQSILSHPNLVEKHTSQDDQLEIKHSHEISWPTSEDEYNEEGKDTEEKRGRTQEDPIEVYRAGHDLEDSKMPLRENLVHQNVYDNYQTCSEPLNHPGRYESKNRELHSTGNLVISNQNSYHNDRYHRRHIVRILDRPLLDLDEDDDDECFDAIEVERQNTYYSQENGGTPHSSDRQIYRMDPPDPIPANRYPEGRRLSTNHTADAPEGATREEIELLNRFIDVASSDFGGQTLSAESEERVRAAALKIGLTSKFVDQLLHQTMKPSESRDPGLTFVAPSEQHSQPAPYDGQNGYHNGHGTYSNQQDRYYAGETETYYTSEYSRSNTKQRGRCDYDDYSFNVWDSLGKGLTQLANITAKTCGLNYHRKERRRDDGDSIVSAISWDDDHGKSSSARTGRSTNRPSDGDYHAATGYAPSANYQNDEYHQHERTRHVTFDDNIDELNYDAAGPYAMDAVPNRPDTPPREKITQLV